MSVEIALLLITLAGLTAYALLGGADFGAGVWDLSPARGPEERELRYHAIGPVWETNHVWLIFVLVLLWTAFPPAFAALCRGLWVPLLVALAGIVIRGSAYAFRASGAGGAPHRIWEVAFAAASTLAPFALGAAAGAVAAGTLDVTPSGGFRGDYLTGWISPTAIFSGLFAVGISGHLAAVYLTREAQLEGADDLVELWRARGMRTGAVLGVLAVVGLVVVAVDAPELWAGFGRRGWPLVALSIVGGLGSLWALYARRYTLAALGAGTAVATVILGWGAAQYPFLVPPTIDVAAAKAPDGALWFLLGSIGAGAVLLVPSLAYLFYLFKGGAAGHLRQQEPPHAPPHWIEDSKA